MTASISTASIIDGKEIAAKLRAGVKKQVHKLQTDHGITPKLSVILVGDDPASHIYVRNKIKACKEIGITSALHSLSPETQEIDLLRLIERLNKDAGTHGILVQLPLPKGLNSQHILSHLDPKKDVDGFHPLNRGCLISGEAGLIPCTPRGVLKLIKSVKTDIAGLDALVIGRSMIVGQPVASLLLAENCTVTIAHSRSKNLADKVAHADIIVAGVGHTNLVKGEWIKRGAIVIDVGINRIETSDGARLAGDVDFEGACATAGAITPVPGGVGPMTIACLMENSLIAACRQNMIDPRYLAD